MKISFAAVKHLREFLRKDMKYFQAVQKKIVELSQGLFSTSNQQRLVGGPEEITIFEAKVPGGMHLVYQIDLQADPDLQVSNLFCYTGNGMLIQPCTSSTAKSLLFMASIPIPSSIIAYGNVLRNHFQRTIVNTDSGMLATRSYPSFN